jgi:hypothetical protein
MSSGGRRTILASLLGGGLLFGCERAALRPPLPDPLLESKRPLQGKSDQAGTQPVAYSEPSLPPLPANALATAPPTLHTYAQVAAGEKRPAGEVPAQPVARPTRPVPAVPAVRSKTPE